MCSLGVAATVDGELVARDWLVKPPGNRYDDVNTEVHGLTAKDTEDAPTFLEVWAGPVDARAAAVALAFRASAFKKGRYHFGFARALARRGIG